MTNKMLPKQTSFEDRLPTSTHVDGFNLKPTLGPTDLPAVQSDIAAITAGTTINPSTGTLSTWKSAENPTFTAADEITIDQGSGINDLAAPGVPVRYSNDGVAWKYGIITGVVTQASTLDLTIAGVAMTDPNTDFFQVGSPEQVVSRQIVIPGELVAGNDQIDSVLKSEVLWPFMEAFLVYVDAKVHTAASGDDVEVAVARGAVGNEITTSTLNLGEATTRIESGTDINESNYKISFQEKIFAKVTNIGSTTPGSDLTVVVIGIVNTFQFTEFVPLAAETPPFAFQFGGSNGSSFTNATGSMDAIEFFSLAVGTGSGADRGDDLSPRSMMSAVYDQTRTFACAGGTTGNSTFDTIRFIDTQSITGDAVDRGDATIAQRFNVGVSGATYGFTLGGVAVTGFTHSNIETILLGTATGDALDRGDLSGVRKRNAGGFNNQIGLSCGGFTTSIATNSIFGLNITTTVGGDVDRGDLLATEQTASALSDKVGDTVYICGGSISSGGLTGTHRDVIQSHDMTISINNAVDRGDLTQTTCCVGANSGDTIGYLSGGGNAGSAIGAIDKFTYVVGTVTVSNRGSMLVPKYSSAGDM